MRKCRNSVSSLINKICSLTLYPVASVFLFMVGVWELSFVLPGLLDQLQLNEIFLSILSICFIAIGIYLFSLSLSIFRFETRKYDFSEAGLEVLTGYKQICLSWGQVEEIGVYAFSATSSLERYQKIFCIFLGQKPESFEKKVLHSYTFAVKNLNTFVVLDYSDDLEYQLKARKIEIRDYRNVQFRNM